MAIIRCRLLFFSSVLVAISGCSSSPAKGVEFERSTFEGKWPFPKANVATVTCMPNTMSVLVDINGKTYGLNGDAIGRGGYPDVRVEFAKDQFGGYVLGDYSVLLQAGLELCE